jgi:hypothetical protein
VVVQDFERPRKAINFRTIAVVLFENHIRTYW